MKITEEQVRYVAGLANLDLSATEVQSLQHDLDEILTHMDKLNELNTANVEPMAQVLSKGDPQPLREDVPHVSLTNEDALANAPMPGAGHFKVPKVIER